MIKDLNVTYEQVCCVVDEYLNGIQKDPAYNEFEIQHVYMSYLFKDKSKQISNYFCKQANLSIFELDLNSYLTKLVMLYNRITNNKKEEEK